MANVWYGGFAEVAIVASERRSTSSVTSQASADQRKKLADEGIAAFLDTWMQVPSSLADVGPSGACPTKEFEKLEGRRTACLGMTSSVEAVGGERVPPFFWDRKHFRRSRSREAVRES